MKTFVVIGLGRFGTAVATELSALGHEVLALDGAEENVQKVADQVTHAVTGDARDPAEMCIRDSSYPVGRRIRTTTRSRHTANGA